ncbi:MAG: hypothetical protein JSV88_05465 [Candidatus Aminicenantes bacterium]|nr:MAG: hypothetical protein JSV88_05465 [Candidatus Aminicenantes bacterium]
MKMKKPKTLVAFSILVCFFIFSWVFAENEVEETKNQTSESEMTKPSLAEIDELMVEKTVENSQKAIKGYELLLKDDPGNYEILYKLAKAYITIIDIKTSALIVEKDEYKPILKKLGKIANDYAKRAYESNPKDIEVVSAYLVSYGYYSASFGIFKAIFKGAAGRYKKLCNEIIEIDETHLGALGYRLLGKLYHVAPWPVGSKKKALKFFKKAVETDNTLLYSHYYIGLIYFNQKKYDLAEDEFRFVLENDANIHEKHFVDAYKREAGNYLTKISKKKRKK